MYARLLASLVLSAGLYIPCAGAEDAVKPPDNAPAAGASSLKTEKDKVSYCVGLIIGMKYLKGGGLDTEILDVKVFADAVQDVLTETKPKLTEPEIQEVMTKFSQKMQAKAQEMHAKDQEKLEAMMKKNKEEGEKFLAENGKKDGVVTLPSGLQYQEIKAGTGKSPTANDTVVTHYRGTLLDGTEFDSSYKRNEPATFGVNEVIKGWTEALQLMKPGAKWKIFIPFALAYGEGGSPPHIPPCAMLTFDLELLEIKAPAAANKVDLKKELLQGQ